MVVRQFRYSGNTVFSNAELERLTNSYLNRPVSFAELGKARDAITKLYIDKGYTTSGAYIPMQTSRDGLVEIRILEGKLGDIKIEITGRLKSDHLRSRLLRAGRGAAQCTKAAGGIAAITGQPPDQDDIGQPVGQSRTGAEHTAG